MTSEDRSRMNCIKKRLGQRVKARAAAFLCYQQNQGGPNDTQNWHQYMKLHDLVRRMEFCLKGHEE